MTKSSNNKFNEVEVKVKVEEKNTESSADFP